MFFKTVERQLQSNDCGVATIRIIYTFYNKYISRDQIINSIDIGKKGISVSGLKDFFEDNGFITEYKLWNGTTSIDSSDNYFPFILPVINTKYNNFLIVKGKGKRKDTFEIHDPGSGTTYFASFDDLKSSIRFYETDEEYAPVKEAAYYTAIIQNDLSVYDLESEKLLEENDISLITNKLSYFKYIKDNFGFKNKESEKQFLIDLLENQEISKVPEKFRKLYYKEGKLRVKVPTILVIKPGEKSDKLEIKNEEKKKSVYWSLYKQLKSQKKLWYIYITAAFFSAFVTQLAVFINQVLIDYVLPAYNTRTLFLFAFGLVIYQIFNIFTSAYKRFVGIHLKNQLDRFFLQKFDTKISTFSLRYLQLYKKGDLMERVSDAMKLKRFFTKFFTSVFIDLSISLYSLVILFFINWQLSLLILLILIVFYYWFRFITPLLQHNERIRFHEKATFLSNIIEKIEAIQIIKSFGIEKKQSQKTNKKIDAYLSIQLKNEYLNLTNTTVVSLIVGIMTVVVILVLSQFAITTQKISLGQIITFIALSTKIFSAFKSILNQNLTLQENQIILKRFFDFDELTYKKESENDISDFTIDTLEIKNMCFSYKTNQPILHQINFSINNQEKIQIEGSNGSGKSTLSKVMTALYDYDSGEILINNTLSKFYNTNSLNRKILLSTSDDILFNDTVLENICLGKDIELSELIELSRKIGFYEFIASKEDGFDFLITNNGKNVSTGQRKKIILLRAFFSPAEIFILDEVLSGIDTESRIAIEKYINQDKRKYIIVSHEPVENISFSKKYRLKDGKLNIL
ncbi:ABC transporter transmembrane domain-containing protein [Aquimarina sp. RZ0]|uniref:ABC transporter transmembrane domain-containing protein n=1 Tax=Aquimarina sp. RZ0 TaxID=2607730 RepID=UPI0011F1F30E|nr:ABC transporter transmembrane domain-containing protein [Aquimarina sp. RZ0]KAA1245495.1 ATP-binding cassette domain-containing protein [Aquimarina sp. RZ0]